MTRKMTWPIAFSHSTLLFLATLPCLWIKKKLKIDIEATQTCVITDFLASWWQWKLAVNTTSNRATQYVSSILSSFSSAFGPHQSVRETSGPLAGKCFTVFTSVSC